MYVGGNYWVVEYKSYEVRDRLRSKGCKLQDTRYRERLVYPSITTNKIVKAKHWFCITPLTALYPVSCIP